MLTDMYIFVAFQVSYYGIFRIVIYTSITFFEKVFTFVLNCFLQQTTNLTNIVVDDADILKYTYCCSQHIWVIADTENSIKYIVEIIPYALRLPY